MIPNLFIPGFPKTGSSALADFLSSHPEVCVSTPKEPYCLLTREEQEKNWIPQKIRTVHEIGFNAYDPYFNSKKIKRSGWFLDASVTYLYSNNALEQFKKYPIEFKSIVVLREPAERSYSLFRYAKQKNILSDSLNFKDCVHLFLKNGDDFTFANIFNESKYNYFLSKFFSVSPSSEKLFLLSENLQNHPAKTMQEICCFLEIDFNFYQNFAFHKRNETYEAKNRLLDSALMAIRYRLPWHAKHWPVLKQAYLIYSRINRVKPFKTPSDLEGIALLKDFYKKDNDALEKMLKIDLSAWK